MQDLLSQIDEQFLQELLKAIDAHSQPRVYDWVLLSITVASIALSFTAIWCTIRISKKQNDIALFEKRYDVLSDVMGFLTNASLLEIALEEKVTSLSESKKVINVFYNEVIKPLATLQQPLDKGKIQELIFSYRTNALYFSEKISLLYNNTISDNYKK